MVSVQIFSARVKILKFDYFRLETYIKKHYYYTYIYYYYFPTLDCGKRFDTELRLLCREMKFDCHRDSRMDATDLLRFNYNNIGDPLNSHLVPPAGGNF